MSLFTRTCMGILVLYFCLQEYFLLSTEKMYSVALSQIQHLWAFWDRGPKGSTSEKIFLVRIRRPKGKNCLRLLFHHFVGLVWFSTGTDCWVQNFNMFFATWPPTLEIGVQQSIPRVGFKTFNTSSPHLG